MELAAVARTGTTPRVGSARGQPPPGMGSGQRVRGLPSRVWNRAVPLVPIQPIFATVLALNSRCSSSANCSAIGERKSLATIVRVKMRAPAGVNEGCSPGNVAKAFGKLLLLIAPTNGNELATFSAMLMNA